MGENRNKGYTTETREDKEHGWAAKQITINNNMMVCSRNTHCTALHCTALHCRSVNSHRIEPADVQTKLQYSTVQYRAVSPLTRIRKRVTMTSGKSLGELYSIESKKTKHNKIK